MMKRQLRVSVLALSVVFPLIVRDLSALPPPQSKKVPPQADINAIGHRNVGKGVNLYSREKEVALGKQLAQEVERSAKLIDDSLTAEYVDRLCQSLTKNSDVQMPITIRVIDSDIADGLTLPGGFLYINKGLILEAQTEAELAGALAHGIAHTALRSSTRLATRADLIQLGSIPAMIFLPYGWAGWVGYDPYAKLNLAIPLTFLKEFREDELAADYFGVQYAYKAGYDPDSFPLLIARVAAQSSPNKRAPKTFTLFPSAPDRIRAMENEIAEILPRREQDIISSSEFEAIKERISSLSLTNLQEPSRNAKPTLRKRLI
jgi:predicted Zn-dependent protease